MVKQVAVDVEESKKLQAYKANGRSEPAPKEDVARLYGKSYVCPECSTELKAKAVQFGMKIECPKCGSGMLENL